MKQYRLKKDLPDAKAGEVFSIDLNNENYYRSKTVFIDGCCARWPVVMVENSPEWWEEINSEFEFLDKLKNDWLILAASSNNKSKELNFIIDRCIEALSFDPTYYAENEQAIEFYKKVKSML